MARVSKGYYYVGKEIWSLKLLKSKSIQMVDEILFLDDGILPVFSNSVAAFSSQGIPFLTTASLEFLLVLQSTIPFHM